jgi:hypothetical protein
MIPNQQGGTILYTLDMICTFMAVLLLLFGIYILPYLFGAHTYDVPQFVVQLSVYYEQHHNIQGFYTILAVVAPLFIAGIVLLIIAKYIAVYVETHGIEPGVPHVDETEYQEHLQTDYAGKSHHAASIAMIVTLMLTVIGVLVAAEYFLVFSITR